MNEENRQSGIEKKQTSRNISREPESNHNESPSLPSTTFQWKKKAIIGRKSIETTTTTTTKTKTKTKTKITTTTHDGVKNYYIYYFPLKSLILLAFVA